MQEDEKFKQNSIEYARKNKKRIATNFASLDIYPQEFEPVSIFMAGSPGAGKTETVIGLLEKIYQESKQKVLHIDPDLLRDNFIECGYDGQNSHIYQHPVSILVDSVHDLALEQNQSYILDGTLSQFEKAKQNIDRSIKRQRFVKIIYIYQDPKLAWSFTKNRERKEGRRIRKEDFINQYFMSQVTVDSLKKEFGNKIIVDFIYKNIDHSVLRYIRNVSSVKQYIPKNISRQDLEDMLL